MDRVDHPLHGKRDGSPDVAAIGLARGLGDEPAEDVGTREDDVDRAAIQTQRTPSRGIEQRLDLVRESLEHDHLHHRRVALERVERPEDRRDRVGIVGLALQHQDALFDVPQELLRLGAEERHELEVHPVREHRHVLMHGRVVPCDTSPRGGRCVIVTRARGGRIRRTSRGIHGRVDRGRPDRCHRERLAAFPCGDRLLHPRMPCAETHEEFIGAGPDAEPLPGRIDLRHDGGGRRRHGAGELVEQTRERRGARGRVGADEGHLEPDARQERVRGGVGVVTIHGRTRRGRHDGESVAGRRNPSSRPDA